MYEKLLIECENMGLTVKETSFPKKIKGFHGLTIDNTIYIDKTLLQKDKYITLAEELMHSKYSHGNILNLKNIKNRKDEINARRKSYEKVLPIEKIIEVFEMGLKEDCEIEEYLNLDIQYIKKVVDHYRQKYGLYKKVNNYYIYFYPNLSIIKVF